MSRRSRHSARHGRGHSAKCREAKRARSEKANKRRVVRYSEPRSDEDASSGLSDAARRVITLPPL